MGTKIQVVVALLCSVVVLAACQQAIPKAPSIDPYDEKAEESLSVELLRVDANERSIRFSTDGKDPAISDDGSSREWLGPAKYVQKSSVKDGRDVELPAVAISGKSGQYTVVFLGENSTIAEISDAEWSELRQRLLDLRFKEQINDAIEEINRSRARSE